MRHSHRREQLKKFARACLNVTLVCTAMYGGYHFLTDTEDRTRQQRMEFMFGKPPATEQAPTYQQQQNERVNNLNALLAKIEDGQTTKEDLVLQAQSKPVPNVTPDVLDHLQDCRDKFTSSSPGMVLECMKATEAQEVGKAKMMKRVAGALTAAFAVVALVGLGVRRSRKVNAGSQEMGSRMAGRSNNQDDGPAGATQNKQSAPKA